MARQLGKDARAVKRAYERAVVKIPKEGTLEPSPGSLQARDPEAYAELANSLAQAGTDGERLSEAAIAKRLNLPPETAALVAKEIRSIYFPTSIEMRNVKLEKLRDLWGMRAEEALAQLTPERISGASPKDLAIIAGIATEKLLLLRGQPTQIIRTERDRLKVEVLANAFMDEAKRRGYELNANVETGEVDVKHVREVE
jgi:hypothetical protein